MASSLFGALLTKKDKSTVAPTDAFAGKDFVAIYFSASWCPPCRGFTPVLSAFYAKHAEAKKLEIVFASLDKTQADYDSYREKMTWDLAIPYGDELSKKLSAKFKVQGIPTLVILDAASGAVITTDGTDGVREDEDGSAFPYRPRSAWDLLGEAGHVIDAKDEKFDVAALRGLSAGVGLYFSAHWCPPCKGFTPELAKWYEAQTGPGGALAGKLDIIFVSSDKSAAEFDEYRRSMPWKSLPTHGGKIKAALSKLFGVEGIPTLVFIDGAGNVLSADGRTKVLAEPAGFPWPPAAVTTLDEAAGSFINDLPTAVLFTDKLTDAGVEAAAIASFTAAGEAVFEAAGRKVDARLRFAIASEGSEAVEPVRKFLGPAHFKDVNGAEALRLTIIDVSSGVKYLWNDGKPAALTPSDARAFVEAFLAGGLTGVPVRE